MVMSRFDLKVFLETIQAHKVTYLHIVPPIGEYPAVKLANFGTDDC